MASLRPAPSVRAFSLLELVVVIVIIGVIAAIAIPRVQGFQDRARVNSAAETVRRVNMKIADEFVVGGEFPSSLKPQWFSAGGLDHPLLPGTTGVETVADLALEHPDPLVWKAGDEPWWYNSINGLFRARVPPQGTQQDTIVLYNFVNGANVRIGAGGQAGSDVVDPGDATNQLGADGDGKGGFAGAIK